MGDFARPERTGYFCSHRRGYRDRKEQYERHRARRIDRDQIFDCKRRQRQRLFESVLQVRKRHGNRPHDGAFGQGDQRRSLSGRRDRCGYFRMGLLGRNERARLRTVLAQRGRGADLRQGRRRGARRR